MKAKILAMSVVFVFLMIGLSGCDELEIQEDTNYILVTVELNVRVLYYHGDHPHNIIGASVLVEINKAGGERVSGTMITDEYGYGEPILTGTFKLYNEQPIETIANLVLESVSNYSDYTFNVDGETIPWETISAGVKMGESTSYTSELSIVGTKNS